MAEVRGLAPTASEAADQQTSMGGLAVSPFEGSIQMRRAVAAYQAWADVPEASGTD